MNDNLVDADIPILVAEASLLADETKRVFSGLPGEQLNWRPREGAWSIGQCFEHLLLMNRPYLKILEETLAGYRRERLWERMPVLPRLFGRLLINALRPTSSRKVKTRPAFYPSSSLLPPSIVASFLEQQGRLIALMEACRGLDLDGITITSPVVGFVTYSLMDACRIVVVHEQRHLLQAMRVLETPGFPA